MDPLHLHLLDVAEHKSIWLSLSRDSTAFRLITKSRFFPPPPSRPVFSSSTLRPHFNNNAAFCERRISFFLLPTSSFLVRFQLLSFSFVELRWSCPSTPFLYITYIPYLVLHPPFELFVLSANSSRFISTIFKPAAAASIRSVTQHRSPIVAVCFRGRHTCFLASFISIQDL